MLLFFIILGILMVLFGALWLNSLFKSEPQQPSGDHIPPQRQSIIPRVPDTFDEARIKSDLAKLRGQPTALAQYIVQAQLRFTQARQIAVLQRWTDFYKAGKAVIAARTELARAHADLQQVNTEGEIKAKEKEVRIAALEAELEEAALRKEDATVRRKNLGKEPPPPPPVVYETKLTPEQERVLKKDDIELRLVRVRQEKATVIAGIADEDERIRVANMYDDRIEDLLQELRGALP